MGPSTGNSMAAALSVIVTAVLWIAVVVGVLAFVLFTMGLFASGNGGSVEAGVVTLESDDVTTGQLVGGLAALAVFAPGIIFICIQLRRILRTLAAGDPFVPDNAPRLARIAVAIAAIEVGRNLVALAVSPMLASTDGANGFSLSINLAAWASVAALLVLAQVFREGARLREEEKMTI